MTSSAREGPRTTRTPTVFFAGLLVLIATITAALGHQLLASPTSTASPTTDVPSDEPRSTPASRSAIGVLGRERDGAVGVDDGVVPAGTTVFDGDVPAVANLDAGLLAALRRAATDAERDGVEMRVNSGWRSVDYQEQLLDQAVSKYGSRAEAARWVATPTTSAHVQGAAIDLGPADATRWLSQHGAEYGLCQIYRNEPWHYELRPEAIDGGCPSMYADPTHDPRMQQ